MNRWNNQLIILGNGFDLECQLRSQFNDYFRTRMEKPWLCSTSDQWKENPDDPENLWDHIFNLEKKNNPKNWKDVEAVILEWVSCKEKNDYEDIASRIQKRYNLFQRTLNGQPLPTSLPGRIDLIFEEHPFRFKEDSFRDLLFTELGLMERAFEDFLIKESASQDYIQKSYNLFCTLRDANTGEDPRETANYILSFNYTAPQSNKMDFLTDLNIECWRNVHGQLGNKNIIFGIDMNQLPDQQKSDPSIRQFTKPYRVLRQSRITVTDEETVGLLEPYRNGENFDTIKIYGHSLGQADYSYFKAIFDHIDLYGSNTRLLFYFPSDHPDIKDELYPQIANLLASYGESMPDHSRGNNLMHKMLLEGRLSLSELNVSDLEF